MCSASCKHAAEERSYRAAPSNVVCLAAAGMVQGRDANATKGSVEPVKSSPWEPWQAVPGERDRRYMGIEKGIAWKARKAVHGKCERHCLDMWKAVPGNTMGTVSRTTTWRQEEGSLCSSWNI